MEILELCKDKLPEQPVPVPAGRGRGN